MVNIPFCTAGELIRNPLRGPGTPGNSDKQPTIYGSLLCWLTSLPLSYIFILPTKMYSRWKLSGMKPAGNEKVETAGVALIKPVHVSGRSGIRGLPCFLLLPVTNKMFRDCGPLKKFCKLGPNPVQSNLPSPIDSGVNPVHSSVHLSGIAGGVQSITLYRELHCGMQTARPPPTQGARSRTEAFIHPSLIFLQPFFAALNVLYKHSSLIGGGS